MIEGFFCCAFLCVLSFLFGMIYAWLQPYCRYCLYKSKNKIEWKCEETENNYDQRIKTYFDGKPKQRIEFEICYRIKPSEVNWFVRIFGDNDWNYPFSRTFWLYEEDAEDEFKEIIKDYVTLDDVRKVERKEGRIKLCK